MADVEDVTSSSADTLLDLVRDVLLRESMPDQTTRFTLALGVGAVALTLAVGGLTARATGFTLADAANYAVIYQAGGNNQLNINNGPGLNGLAVNGNIGIDNTAPKNGKLQL